MFYDFLGDKLAAFAKPIPCLFEVGDGYFWLRIDMRSSSRTSDRRSAGNLSRTATPWTVSVTFTFRALGVSARDITNEGVGGASPMAIRALAVSTVLEN